MTGALQLDRERLAKLCGLFESDHAGERANAAAAADKLVRQAGMRWSDVILPVLPSARESEIEDTRDAIRFCADFAYALTAREREFIASIAQRPGRLSHKQLAVLARLVAKCRAAARRGAA